MNCHRCGGKLITGASFCVSCGSEARGLCPSCREVNEPSNNFCFSCGHRLAEDSPASGNAENPPGATDAIPAVVCPRCHQGNEPRAAYCRACGFPLEERVARDPEPARAIPAFAQGYPGGFWWRFLAFWIDTALMLLVFAIFLPLIGGGSVTEYYEGILDLDSETEVSFGRADILDLGQDIIYYTATIALARATIGMFICRLRVMRPDGSRIGIGRAFARYWASQLSLLLLGVGYLMIAFRKDKRGLHDLICDTVVIRRPGR